MPSSPTSSKCIPNRHKHTEHKYTTHTYTYRWSATQIRLACGVLTWTDSTNIWVLRLQPYSICWYRPIHTHTHRAGWGSHAPSGQAPCSSQTTSPIGQLAHLELPSAYTRSHTCIRSSCYCHRHMGCYDPRYHSSCQHLGPLTPVSSCWYHRQIGPSNLWSDSSCCSQSPIDTAAPPLAVPKQTPLPRKRVRKEFNKKIGETTLMRHRAW